MSHRKHNPYRQGHGGGRHEALAIGFVILVFVYIVMKVVEYGRKIVW